METSRRKITRGGAWRQAPKSCMIADMESSEPQTGQTYRTKGVMRPAQHKFLLLGVLLVIGIGVVLAILNERVKEETKFQQQLQNSAAATPAGNLGYTPPETEIIPPETASPAPTTADAPAE